ncbi:MULTISPECIES: thioredoxin family protein [Mycetohabitans]|uniref:Thioredoxin family protein n=1 Tax=Mycetohabitans rhizoxinica TaxID=412963 RepID=A0ABZ2PSA7_9BURK|nr:thioredoxin family protein [Mycetohabitans sp. B2]MCF7697158.1 thioredoxin family protein [Mycetohabitans sp. B2]
MEEQCPYTPDAPAREQLDVLAGVTVIEFGTNWCGYCQRAQPVIAEALGRHQAMRHLKIEDGPGRLLGRSFRVKLWPTLIFLRDGQERARVVRPTCAEELDDALATLR